MRTLSSADILQTWEESELLSQAEKSLCLLTRIYPDMNIQELAELTLGERDALLLKLRQKTFGDNIEIYCQCVNCDESLELNLKGSDILIHKPDEFQKRGTFTKGDLVISYHLPTTLDILKGQNVHNEEDAWQVVVKSCIEEISKNDDLLDANDLSVELLEELSQKMGEEDPQAEVLFNMRCPKCKKETETIFDIGQYLETEIMFLAKQILTEVQTIAKFYGWSEERILAMSPKRRQFYLEALAA